MISTKIDGNASNPKRRLTTHAVEAARKQGLGGSERLRTLGSAGDSDTEVVGDIETAANEELAECCADLPVCSLLIRRHP